MIHEKHQAIYDRIVSRVSVEYLGFILNGIPSPCWIWQGSDSGTGRGGGYGRISYLGCTTAVHILMYKIKFGPILPNRHIDHMCNNRRCCNYDHLQMVTPLKNQRLRVKRAKEQIQCIQESSLTLTA